MATVKFEPTPCPPPRAAARPSVSGAALGNRLIAGKPRKMRVSRRESDFDIHEDTFDFVRRSHTLQNSNPQAKHASRPQSPHSAATSTQVHSLAPLGAGTINAYEAKRRRISTTHNITPLPEEPFDEPTIALKSVPEHSELKREPRRRTIYIPSDDTTIFTIHPGASLHQDPARSRQTRRSDVFLEMAEIAGSPAKATVEVPTRRRQARNSLMVAPRRGPLQSSARAVNILPAIADVPGSGGGKENVPPGTESSQDDKCAKKEWCDRNLSYETSTVSKPKGSVFKGFGSGAATEGPTAQEAPESTQSQSQSRSQRKSLLLGNGMLANSTAKKRLSCLPQTASQKTGPNPVIPEQILNPQLYEDNWLGQQETAISQLVNDILAKAGGNRLDSSKCHASQRQSLMDTYQEQSMVLLHKRLQASLRFGALSIPHDKATQIAKFRDDLGQRQRFIDLWTKTYNPDSLRVVLEVVTGRELSNTSLDCSTSESIDKPLEQKLKPLVAFIKKFLIYNEDSPHAGQSTISRRSTMHSSHHMDVGSATWMWRRTVLRSLMIIVLLDKGQETGVFNGCLFQDTSPFKSSMAVLQALAMLLLPSIGDVVRALNHLNYDVTQTQCPLEEKTYQVSNLATDLRDGLIMTRLVEILLYPPSSLVLGESVTITHPSGENLTLKVGKNTESPWILSQHLKYPCLGRVQRLYNTQVAFGAIANIKGTGNLVQDIKAEDIVDGHREKTIGLLWSLVGRWGVSTLVDMNHLADEINRLDRFWTRRAPLAANDCDTIGDVEAELSHAEGEEQSTLKLKAWAMKVARAHGVAITNLSTSFADGRAFEALVREYSCALSSGSEKASNASRAATNESQASEPRGNASLTAALRSMGCSRAFIRLFYDDSRIPTAQTTVPLLAFLASRVLPAARLHFSAGIIQRAWRWFAARTYLKKKVALAKLAGDCAFVVQTRQRIVMAALTIQRWWRAVRLV